MSIRKPYRITTMDAIEENVRLISMLTGIKTSITHTALASAALSQNGYMNLEALQNFSETISVGVAPKTILHHTRYITPDGVSKMFEFSNQILQDIQGLVRESIGKG